MLVEAVLKYLMYYGTQFEFIAHGTMEERHPDADAGNSGEATIFSAVGFGE
jgi:hypothetical protein